MNIGMNIGVMLGVFNFLAATSIASDAQPSTFEILARLNVAPGNVTLTDDGRVIMSLHQFYEPEVSVVELAADGSIRPFPNPELNDRGTSSDLKLDSVLGIRADVHGIVWMLDNGMRGGVTPKLLAWNTGADTLHRVIHLPAPVTPPDAFVNDLVVDMKRDHIYISDPAGGSNAALIIVDLKTGSARRVLEGHPSVVPEKLDLAIDGLPIRIRTAAGDLVKPHIGVNPITADLNDEWVYFGPMHARSLYRVKADDLVDPHVSPAELGKRVQRYSEKPISDGITMDRDGNIYLGELEANAIGVIAPDRKYIRIAQSRNLSWVDSFSFGPEGRLYAVVNRLHQSAPLNGGQSESKPPYFLIRIEPFSPGLPGR